MLVLVACSQDMAAIMDLSDARRPSAFVMAKLAAQTSIMIIICIMIMIMIAYYFTQYYCCDYRY